MNRSKPKHLDGLPVHNFETLLALAGLATVSMLKLDRLRPADGQAPVACYWSGYDYVDLYPRAEAVAMPALSPGRQRLYDAARTCARCQTRFKTTIGKLRDGKRYCSKCSEPAARDLWDLDRERDRPIVARWAAEVLADPSVVLVATVHAGWTCQVLVCDLFGNRIVDDHVRMPSPHSYPPEDRAAEVAEALSADEFAELIAGRRVLSWWDTTNLKYAGTPASSQVAEKDRVGPWWDRWLREPSSPGAYLREQPWLLQHRPPGDNLHDQIDAMRAMVAEMAGGLAAEVGDSNG